MPVVAVDVASGLDASTGEVAEVAVSADVTVTFHAAKIGHAILPGRAHTGALVVVPIGIPADVAAPAPADAGGRRRRSPRCPAAPAFGSKYDAGNVLAIGGSRGMTGAIVLCSRAALRAGAGLVVAAVPASQQPVVAGLGAGADDAAPAPSSTAASRPRRPTLLLERAQRAAAVVARPRLRPAGGHGRPRARASCRRSPRRWCSTPTACTPSAPTSHLLLGRDAPTVITPHAGEAARLLGVTTAEVAAHRLASARTLAERTGAVCVLKGADTIIAAPDGRLAVRDGDDPRLATAGTGDVLCGTIAGLLARGIPAFEAAAAGAAAHLAAARVGARRPRAGGVRSDRPPARLSWRS